MVQCYSNEPCNIRAIGCDSESVGRSTAGHARGGRSQIVPTHSRSVYALRGSPAACTVRTSGEVTGIIVGQVRAEGRKKKEHKFPHQRSAKFARGLEIVAG